MRCQHNKDTSLELLLRCRSRGGNRLELMDSRLYGHVLLQIHTSIVRTMPEEPVELASPGD